MPELVLRARGLRKYYGPKPVLDGVDLDLNRGDRAVLVGENGVGKSTLARLLMGIEGGDGGTIQLASRCIAAYLPQELNPEPSQTVGEYISQRLGELHAIERQMQALERQMESGQDVAAALDDYGRLQTLYEERDGYTLPARREQIFAGLGLRHIEAGRALGSLSGGEKTRIGLAALLLQAPDLLILDEPTNHLDFAGLAWLEAYLLSYPHALLMITHDRHFINRLASKILDLSAVSRRLTSYHGNYDDYLEQRQAEYRRQVDAYHGQAKRLKELRAQVKKNTHNQRKAKRPADGDKWIKFTGQQQAARTVGKLARSARQELSALEANRLDNPRHVWHVEYSFDPLPLTSMEPLRLVSLSVGFGQRQLISGAEALLRKGERVALVAPNGCGKTTLLRMIAGELKPGAGHIALMPSVKLGYLDQTGEALDGSRNVVDTLRRIGQASDDQLLTLLHRCGLFRDAQLAGKAVAELSLGQRRKLGIACLIHSRANLLLLDEPSNHLDLLSLEALEQALLSFPGAILAATHDRWFIERIATAVWHLRDGKLVVA